MIEKLQAHYGFTRMPFRRDLAPGMLHRHARVNRDHFGVLAGRAAQPRPQVRVVGTGEPKQFTRNGDEPNAPMMRQ